MTLRAHLRLAVAVSVTGVVVLAVVAAVASRLIGVDDDARNASLAGRTVLVMAVLAAVVVALCTLLVTWTARQLLRGVDELRRASERVVAGDLELAAPPSGTDELAQVAAAFFDMAHSLRQKTLAARIGGARLSRSNHKLAEMNRRLEHTLRRVQETQAQLLQAEKLSLAGQLAQSIAHEINNPLSLVRGNLEVIEGCAAQLSALWKAARAAGPHLEGLPAPHGAGLAAPLAAGADDDTIDELSEMVAEMAESVCRIADLVSGFRQLATISGQAITPEAVDLGHLVRASAASLRVAPGGILVEAGDRAGGMVHASHDDLATALANLLSYLNGPARDRAGGGTIALRVGPGATNRVELTIAHDALTLSQDEVARLFDPRVEVNTSRGRVLRLNLELALAHQLLYRNGARIAVQAEVPRGVRFDIDLPAA